MVIAVLFNSDDPSLGCVYGDEIRDKIFGTQVLQRAARHMKIGCGDVLFHSHTDTAYGVIEHAEKTFFDGGGNRLFKRKIYDCLLTSTIFAWIIQNVTDEIAESLHSALTDFPPYLGMHEVDFSNRFHLVYYLHSIGENYRINGNSIRIFCPMGDGQYIDFSGDLKELKNSGFTDAAVEDSGARFTIFDDYDTLSHFEQLESVKNLFAPCFKGGEADAYGLCMMLRDSDPRLFDALGSAVRAIPQIRSGEDVAHVALSGRRFIEQLANSLFPPRKELCNGRKVGNAEYRNRIWAFIEENCKEDRDKIEKLGKEADRLNDLFCKGVHDFIGKDEVLKAFADLAVFTMTLLSLQPLFAGNPYLAYNDGLQEFLNKLTEEDL